MNKKTITILAVAAAIVVLAVVGVLVHHHITGTPMPFMKM